MPTGHDRTAVDRYDVTVRQDALPGDSVHDLVVDGGAHRGRVAVVAQEVGLRVVLVQDLAECTVEVRGGGPGDGGRDRGVERE